ncbi:VOC family protein [Stackebrandtia nassauensis]|uniref:Putative pterin-4-alpha-carbinolamine dehydratase n=1 Tax=Stackebrandtia nassauensis (strain DSM 44728 / CIP 108903 / NRRL B-16338 / NBRC 102104 / LLR-40K-21) TaxID=446470 RepID=D3PZC8_STANL|nr:VOC family protein [Stackebrandtia nassauensis]ADD41602.1 transcriptional coactivator/pterin dehydratase [Stackebrandtia nassauensis DSM 44728]
MSERLHGWQVQPQLPNWRVLFNRVYATFRTGDFNTGARFVAEIALLADEADHHPDVHLRYPSVAVEIYSHDIGGMSSRDVNLARQISELAENLGIAVDDAAPQLTEIGIDAMDIPAVKPFWRELLGYADDDEVGLVDPRGLGAPVWFQQMDEPRPQRNRIHLDVWVPHDAAQARIDAAVAAGGRLLSDAEAPAFWVLADPEGNEACVCTWQSRDQDPQ